jgi:La-related protein 7
VQARTVVAENLPIDYSVEKLEELFGKVGSVKMVRICHPETPNGGNQTAVKLPKSDMVISNKLHALVEYEAVDLAEKAVAELTDERNWRSGLRVRLLLRRMVYC